MNVDYRQFYLGTYLLRPDCFPVGAELPVQILDLLGQLRKPPN